MRFAIPMIPEPILSNGVEVGQIYNCYGYDKERDVFLVTDEYENKLVEVKLEKQADGTAAWAVVESFWIAPVEPPMDDEEAWQAWSESDDNMANAIMKWLEAA